MDDGGYGADGFPPILVAFISGVTALAVLMLYHCLRTTWHYRQELLMRLRNDGTAEEIVDDNSTRRMQASISELIPMSRYGKDVGELSKTQDKTCPICLCEFTDDEPVRILPDCFHPFHVPCIDMWLFSHGNCPVCRTPLGSRRPESDR